MKKLKLNFGDGGIQGWLIRHVEKFVLVLFAGVMVWFVVSGTRLEGIKAGQSPDILKSQALEAVTAVNQPRWEQVKDQPERRFESAVEKSVLDLIAFKADKIRYPVPKAWDPPMSAKLKLRSDPQIFAPFGLKVVEIYGMFALVPDESDVDPLAPLEAEEEDPKKPGKKLPAKKPVKKPAAGGMPGMPGMAGMAGMPGMPGSDKKKGKGKADLPGMPGLPGMDGEGGMPGMPGVPGGGGMPGMGGMGGLGKFADSQIIGWRPPASATIRIHAANVVMALVPFEKQTEEFDAKLAYSLDYDPFRDKPHYRYFRVQRVDVTDNPEADPKTIAEEVWKAGTLSVGESLDAMQTWAGGPNDIMDLAYLMPLIKGGVGLTQPLPPFVQRDIYDAMTHPDIPLAATAAVITETPGARRPKAGEAGTPDDEIPTGGTGVPNGGVGGMPGGMPGMAGGPAGGPPGGAKGMPGIPGGGMAGMSGMAGGPGGAKGMPGIPGGGMAGMPGGGMAGIPGGGMGGMYGAGSTEALVKYKLVRFIDQKVEKGRKYRYRVKVILDDPNYPSEPHATPSLAGLDDEARARVRALEAKDAKSGAKSTALESAYSVASEVATPPPAEWFFAGSVEPESTGPLGDGKKYPNFSRQYSGKSLVVVQDDKKAVDVPAKWEVFKGSAINFTMPEVEVIHPAMGDKRKLEKYSFQTNAVVADMRGGEDIPVVTGEHSTPLKAPGEILFVDSAGNMHVRNEVDDIEYFHRFLGPEEKEPKKKKPEEGDAADFGGMMPGIPGATGGAPSMPGMPSSQGTKPKPKR